jgi:hypothetical protein
MTIEPENKKIYQHSTYPKKHVAHSRRTLSIYPVLLENTEIIRYQQTVVEHGIIRKPVDSCI